MNLLYSLSFLLSFVHFFFLCCFYWVVGVVSEKFLVEIICTCVCQVLSSINDRDHWRHIRLEDELHSLQGHVYFWVTWTPRVTLKSQPKVRQEPRLVDPSLSLFIFLYLSATPLGIRNYPQVKTDHKF